MKKAAVLLTLFLVVQTSSAQAQQLKSFLKTCGWGVIIGATAGVVSLAFEDKPSENWSNVAKGASLGLYGGIAYGFYNLNKEEVSTNQHPDFTVFPKLNEGKIEGLQISSTILEF